MESKTPPPTLKSIIDAIMARRGVSLYKDGKAQ